MHFFVNFLRTLCMPQNPKILFKIASFALKVSIRFALHHVNEVPIPQNPCTLYLKIRIFIKVTVAFFLKSIYQACCASCKNLRAVRKL